MVLGLTKRQSEILAFIQDTIKKNDSPPTRSEIAQKFGFRSANSAEDHLQALARKAYIELAPGVSRGIRLVEKDKIKKGKMLPVVGRVAAGQPILAIENVEENYFVDEALFELPPDYLLRVKGLSMINAGIKDNDLLVVHASKIARDGAIVVARINEEVTVKRFTQKDSKVFLFPENPDFKTIEINLESEEFSLEGLGIGVIRASI